jgi:hypothetical protein
LFVPPTLIYFGVILRLDFFYLFIYSYVHTLFEPFLPPAPCSLPVPPPPLLPGRSCSALFSNFVEEKT